MNHSTFIIFLNFLVGFIGFILLFIIPPLGAMLLLDFIFHFIMYCICF